MLLNELDGDFAEENRADFLKNRMHQMEYLIGHQDVDALTQLLQDDQENIKALKRRRNQIGVSISNLNHVKTYLNAFVNEVES